MEGNKGCYSLERQHGITEDEIKQIGEAFVEARIADGNHRYFDQIKFIGARGDGYVQVQYTYTNHRGKINSYDSIDAILCISCQALQSDGLALDYIPWSMRESSRIFPLGLLKDILRQSYCALCRTVSKVLPPAAWGSWLLPKGGDTSVALRLKHSSYDIIDITISQGTSFQTPDTAATLGGIFINRDWQYSFKEVRENVPTGSSARPRFATMHPNFWDERYLQNNKVVKAQFKRLKDALGVCETSHPSCGQLVSKAKAPAGLMLIDVGQRCIGPAEPRARYIALSYVWGGIKMLQTTLSNLKQLKRPGSLIREAGKLPQAILDAMDIAEALNERFLWVDSLCIIQDDAISKHSQISSMNIVYGQAALTLIAMDGENANSKLFEEKEQSILWETSGYERIVGGGRVGARTPWLSPLLAASYYNQRGWTFQERILSVRCLYFTKHEIYFQCPKCICTSEGFLLEGENLSKDLASLNPFFAERNKLIEGKTTKRQRKGKNKNQTVSFEDEQFLVYSDLVEDYTAKQLSYESDILSAFEGILQNVFEGSSPVICGLPERDLDAALLWVSQGTVIRRGIIKGAEGGTLNANYAFPSWAWIGWKGSPAVYFIDNFGKPSSWDNSQLQSCIEWISVSSPGAKRSRRFDIQRKTPVRHLRGVEESSFVPVVDKANENLCVDTLLFSADIVPLQDLSLADPVRVEFAKTAGAGINPLLDPKGNHCGVLIGSLSPTMVAQMKSSTSSFEWILLSVNRDVTFRPPWQGLSKKIFDCNVIGHPKSYTANVMLIEWKGAVAERVGLGIVCVDAWDNMCAKSKTIVLA